jgi:hypothetical protein
MTADDEDGEERSDMFVENPFESSDCLPSGQGQRRYSNNIRSTINRAVSPSKARLANGFKRSTSVLLPKGEGKRRAGPSGAQGAENESIGSGQAESDEKDRVVRFSTRSTTSERLGQSRSVSGFVKWFGY